MELSLAFLILKIVEFHRISRLMSTDAENGNRGKACSLVCVHLCMCAGVCVCRSPCTSMHVSILNPTVAAAGPQQGWSSLPMYIGLAMSGVPDMGGLSVS